MITDKEYLVLSSLAYVNFQSEDFNESLSSIDIVSKLPVSERDEWSKNWGSLVDEMDDWQIVSYINNNAGSGFCGVAYKKITGGGILNGGTEEIVFAFRGTEPSITVPNDLITDVQLAALCQEANMIPQFNEAKQWVYDCLKTNFFTIPGVTGLDLSRYADIYNVSFTGHSLGGALAQYLSSETVEANTRTVDVKIYNK